MIKYYFRKILSIELCQQIPFIADKASAIHYINIRKQVPLITS
jgi:hypothetical protein